MEVTADGAGSIPDVTVMDGMQKLQGLMFRESGRALLVFNQQGFHGVWMPFMRFSIDIAFISAEKEIVGITRDVPPLSFDPGTWKIYRPPRRCQYILEVEAGELDAAGFSVGDRVMFQD